MSSSRRQYAQDEHAPNSSGAPVDNDNTITPSDFVADTNPASPGQPTKAADSWSGIEIDYASFKVGEHGRILHADCFDWLQRAPENCISAIVTDPPYGVKEFQLDQLEKLHNGNQGGIWRIPPAFDGNVRSPLPRFTALTAKEREAIYEFFKEWSSLTLRVLRPGAHVFMASNAFISPLTWQALIDGGLEFRGEFIRLVRTLRGGDRPKNAEKEFADVCSMPRGCYEPWGIFRKPMPSGMRVQDALREFGTGGLRRLPDGKPFVDVVQSERTPKRERKIADHPSLKPQSILRLLCYASLPLGSGVILDPFSGSGSTVAAANAVGVQAVGLERFSKYFEVSRTAAPALSRLSVQWCDSQLELGV